MNVGTVMFFNVRSAILQQMSIVNYINFADNNNEELPKRSLLGVCWFRVAVRV